VSKTERREVLKLIHTNPAVRLVWDYLRQFRAAGHDDPAADPLTKAGLDELRRLGVPIPNDDEWWRE
jgi:hypothetical protein